MKPGAQSLMRLIGIVGLSLVMAAIMAATSNSADAVGLLDEVGTIEEGKLADLIVLEKDPLENISNLRALEMVIKDGKLVNLSRDEGQTSFWKLYFLE